MKIMSCNIWGDYFNNPVEERKDAFFKLFSEGNADVIGIQEFTKSWYNSSLFSELSDKYEPVGGRVGNFVPLIYNKLDYELIDSGDFLYTTADKTKGITWVVLKSKKDEKIAGFCNTHFWWNMGTEKSFDDEVRMNNAKCLVERMKELSSRYSVPVFCFGDMNTYITSSVFEYYKEEKVQPLILMAQERDEYSSHHGDPVRDGTGVYRGSKTQNDYKMSLDHILAYNFNGEVKEYRVLAEQELLDASDHSPVTVTVSF